MQLVGKIQASVADVDGAAAQIATVIEDWASQKFQHDEDGVALIKKSQVEALVDRSSEQIGEWVQTKFELLEPIDGGDFQTRLTILQGEGRIFAHCAMSVASNGGLAPPNVDVFVPRVVRTLLALPLGWQAPSTSEGVFPKDFLVSRENVAQLVQLLQSPIRKLPVVVVADLNGQPLGRDVHIRLASDLCGLAHICRLNRDAAWAMTEELGPQWSCYNGAIRLFWPFRGNRDDPRHHPLWTFDYLTRRDEVEESSRDRIRKALREIVLEASTFVADEPAFARFGTAKLRIAASRDVKTASEADLRTQIEDLKGQLEQKDKEIAELRDGIAALSTAAYTKDAALKTEEAEIDAPPESVRAAVQLAKSKFSAEIAFGDNIDGQITTLNPDAGPPEKVYRYLKELANLSRALDGSATIGKSVPLWLRDQGVTCSEESETISNNKQARKQRTFSINSQDVYCELHAKPNDGVSPDMCVRIYFALSRSTPRVQIGYIGRHFV